MDQHTGSRTSAETSEAEAQSAEPVSQLVSETLADARRLVALEVEIARKEMSTELRELRTSAVLFGVAGVAAVLGAAMLLVALVLAIAPVPLTAIVVGVVLFVVAAIAGFAGKGSLPSKPMNRSRQRLKSDLEQLKEHVA